MRTGRMLGTIAGGALLLAGAATASAGDADELEALKRSQRELAEKVEAQQKRILELETQVSGAGGLQAASTAAMQESIEEYLKKGIPSKKGSMLRFYGTARLDLVWDDSTPSNTQTIAWVRSEDPTVASGADRNDADFTMYPRMTKVGMEMDAGKVASLDDATLTGKIEVDFYNSGLTGQSESRAALRMRHAYLNLDGGTWSLLAGQTSELISPLFPNVNYDMLMWGAGNLGDRRPQLRATKPMAMGNGKLTLAAALGLTGAVDNQGLDADGLRDGEASGYPTVQARAGFAAPVEGRSFEFGLWGHYARESIEVPVAGEDLFQSAAIGIDASLPVTADLTLRGEAWTGRNLDDVRGGVLQGVNVATGNEVESQGGWFEAVYKASKILTVSAGVGEDNPDGGDLGAGGRIRNRVWWLGTSWNHDPVVLGLDFMHWHTQFKGMRGGLDNRVQASISYNF